MTNCYLDGVALRRYWKLANALYAEEHEEE